MPPLTPSGFTPGVSKANCSQRRELTGRFDQRFANVLRLLGLLGFKKRISVVTVTNVCWADTGISMSILAVADLNGYGRAFHGGKSRLADGDGNFPAAAEKPGRCPDRWWLWSLIDAGVHVMDQHIDSDHGQPLGVGDGAGNVPVADWPKAVPQVQEGQGTHAHKAENPIPTGTRCSRHIA
jgi:hypothetical protein